MQGIFSTVLLLIFITAVFYCDIRYKKIFNWLTLPFIILGIILNTWQHGASGLLLSLMGTLTGLVILIFPFFWGWVGGGDVKFLAAAGSFIGAADITISTIYGLVLFGVAALIGLLAKRRLKIFITQLFITIFTWKHIKGIGMIEVSGRLPLGVFLGLGIILKCFFVDFDILNNIL